MCHSRYVCGPRLLCVPFNETVLIVCRLAISHTLVDPSFEDETSRLPQVDTASPVIGLLSLGVQMCVCVCVCVCGYVCSHLHYK